MKADPFIHERRHGETVQAWADRLVDVAMQRCPGEFTDGDIARAFGLPHADAWRLTNHWWAKDRITRARHPLSDLGLRYGGSWRWTFRCP